MYVEPPPELGKRTGFIAILKKFLSQGIREAYCSAPRSDLHSVPAIASIFSRIDLVLSGQKHMIWPELDSMSDAMLQPGDAHFAAAGAVKHPQWDSLHEMSSIVFMHDCIRFTYICYDTINDYFQNAAANIFYHTVHPLSPPGHAMLDALIQLSGRGKRPGFKEALTALLHIALSALEDDNPTISSKSLLTFQKVHQYLCDNFTQPITRESVASTLSLNHSHISRLFGRYSSLSFKETLQQLRMEHAKKLLRSSDLQIKEIACACGYCDATFFIAAFRKFYGITPGKFRLS